MKKVDDDVVACESLESPTRLECDSLDSPTQHDAGPAARPAAAVGVSAKEERAPRSTGGRDGLLKTGNLSFECPPGERDERDGLFKTGNLSLE